MHPKSDIFALVITEYINAETKYANKNTSFKTDNNQFLLSTLASKCNILRCSITIYQMNPAMGIKKYNWVRYDKKINRKEMRRYILEIYIIIEM